MGIGLDKPYTIHRYKGEVRFSVMMETYLTDVVLVALNVMSHLSPHFTTEDKSADRLFVTEAMFNVDDEDE